MVESYTTENIPQDSKKLDAEARIDLIAETECFGEYGCSDECYGCSLAEDCEELYDLLNEEAEDEKYWRD